MNIDLRNLTKMINLVYYPAFRFRGRFLVLYGGSGSGKSYTIADKILVRLMKEDKHNILCVRATQRSVSKSQFPLLVGEIKRWGLSQVFKVNHSLGNESITFVPNGNRVIFSGLDDVEKLKSIYDITSIWIEEANEILPEDFRELNRRLRGYEGKNRDGSPKYMQFMITFNPVSELNWLKSRFFDDDTDTLILYGEEQSRNCKDDVNKYNTMVIHSTYKDNRFIDDVYAKEMEELKKYDEDEYNVYALGLWGIPGGTYFHKGNVTKRIREIREIKPLKRGYFEFKWRDPETMDKILDETIEWIDDDEGYIRIYEEPKKGYPYVGGGDTAGEGSDWNVGYFTNNVTEEDAAVLRVNFDEDLYAHQMYCMGRYYNNALLGIETNFSTHPVKELKRIGYDYQYWREERPDAISGKVTKIFGFLTNKLTRPTALGMLRVIMRTRPEKIKDIRLLEEMTTFVKNEKGKPEAVDGQHDDTVMARAINCYIKEQQRNYIIEDSQDKPQKLIDKMGVKRKGA